MWKEETQNGRGRGGQRELMPAPHWLSKQRRYTVVDVVREVRQMLALSAEVSTASLLELSAESFPVLEQCGVNAVFVSIIDVTWV